MYKYIFKSPKYRPALGTLIQTFIVDMLLLKNPQFLPNDYETRSKLSTHEFQYLILIEFHNHWVKIVAFYIKAYVCTMKVWIGVPRSVGVSRFLGRQDGLFKIRYCIQLFNLRVICKYCLNVSELHFQICTLRNFKMQMV